MDVEEIAMLLRPFIELNRQQLADVSTYISLLQQWNLRINLTAVRNPKEIVTRHFGESFFAARTMLARHDSGTIIDFGSGPGFPGLPIAMFAPDANVTLIESNGKKAAFLSEAIRSLNLKNVSVFSRRAEGYSHRAKLVVMRAVEKFEMALVAASRLVEPKGMLAVMIGSSQVERARVVVPQCRWEEPASIPGSHARVLLAGSL